MCFQNLKHNADRYLVSLWKILRAHTEHPEGRFLRAGEGMLVVIISRKMRESTAGL